MKAIVTILALTVTSLSAFAVGDMAQKLDAKAAQDYYIKYQSIASEVGCSGWMANGGEFTGGGMPGYEVQTISLNIIQSKSSATSTLKITSTTDERKNTHSLSFECSQQ